jgi:radical SAM protein with 4Fe4S-binding SPASM domain
MRHRIGIAASYFRRQAVLSGGPIEITIESTSRCNLSCPMCPRHVFNFDNESMSLELYRRIVAECKDHVEFVWPYGIGEPMMHASIFEMIEITRDAGIRTGLSTNATLLDASRCDRLLDSGLDYLILAFDGASKETYEKYRTGALFENTRANILRLLEKKRERASKLHVVLQMVLLRENVKEIESYRQLWSLPGVDEIRFKRDEIRLEESRIPGAHLEGERRNPCYLLWRGPLYVRYDGMTYPCCYMYDSPPVGDLKSQSLMDVWNSPAMVKLREAHLSGDLREHPTCQGCQASRPSRAVFYGSLVMDSLTVRKAVPALEKLARLYNRGVFERKARGNSGRTPISSSRNWGTSRISQ